MSRRNWLKGLASTIALFSIIHLFASGCTEESDTIVGTTTGPSTQPGSEGVQFISGGTNSCSGNQNSEVNVDRAVMECELVANEVASTIEGTCTLSNYFCSGTGAVSGGTFGQDGSCQFDVLYPDGRITYSCDQNSLDTANRSIDLSYLVNDANSQCFQDRGTVNNFTCSSP